MAFVTFKLANLTNFILLHEIMVPDEVGRFVIMNKKQLEFSCFKYFGARLT